MMLEDQNGNPLSGATAEGLAHYEKALGLLGLFRNDPLAEADAAIAAAPAMVMARVLKAWLLLLGTEPAGLAPARETFLSAVRLSATRREAQHLRAAAALLDGRWHEAARVLADHSREYPRDLLALQVGHQLDFFTGESRMLRDRMAAALPAWRERDAGFHSLLGMHAFGLEECGQYTQAEGAGRWALELEPRDAWAKHAVAHVMEMQDRRAEGVAWLRAAPEHWSGDSFLAVHNWWHLALFHLGRGETGEVLWLYDGAIAPKENGLVLEYIDASALLWRLLLRGIDAGGRWAGLADRWRPYAQAGHYAFNDVHAMMAFVGAERADDAEAVLEAQRAAMARGGDNADFTREVGHPVALALRAFGDGEYARCASLLRPLPTIAHRFGGSHAQRAVITETLAEAERRQRKAA